jgi:YD repeat-containing protein
MKLKIISFCFLLIIILGSCKKEDLSDTGASVNNGASGAKLLSKVLVDNQSATEYLYNDSNQIVQEKCKYDLTLYTYNSKGQLETTVYYGNDNVLSTDAQVYQTALNNTVWVTAATGVNGGSMAYTYNDNGQLIRTTYSRPQSTISEYSDFTYDSNNRITRQTMSWDNTPTGYIDYSYDSKGNLIKEILYNLPASGTAELITTTEYSFDNQLNPYKSASRLLIPGINTNQNNIIKETYTIHLPADQGSDNVQVTETSYTYNNAGYPLTENSNIAFVY